MTLELTVKTEDAGARLDAFIAAHAPELTRSQAARLIEEGAVTVGGVRPAKSARVAPGETVAVCVPEPQETALTAQDIPLDVVYEDEDVIVVNKPTGMVVHPALCHAPEGSSPGRSPPGAYSSALRSTHVPRRIPQPYTAPVERRGPSHPDSGRKWNNHPCWVEMPCYRWIPHRCGSARCML